MGHFHTFTKRGKPNQWKCCGKGARRVNHEQQVVLVRPFAEEEVWATIKGLNAGTLGPEVIPVLF